jgi:hypothetical protein
MSSSPRGGASLSGRGKDAIDCLQNMTLAIREWIGLVAYRLSGKIDNVFPAPG